MITRCHVWIFFVVIASLDAGSAYSQQYPNRPIRIFAAEAGGIGDYVARLMAQGLTSSFGRQAIVENRGGSVIIPAVLVAKALPDGHTLLCHTGNLWLQPYLQSNLPYDPLKDFSPIAMLVMLPNVLVVHPSLPVKSVKELIALAKARPGELNYGSSGLGGSIHLSAELLNSMAGLNIVRVNYKGSVAALNDVISGQLQLMFANGGAAGPHVKSARLRAVAVTSAHPSALFPGLPTVAASGLPGYESVGVQGCWAPAGTPEVIINLLNDEIIHMLAKPDVKEKLLNAGAEPAGTSPQQFATTINAEMGKWGKLIKDLGIRGD